MAFLEIEKAAQDLSARTPCVQNFDLAVERGEFVSFLGPSGCGKTTTLRMVAGFEMPTAGTIRIDGRDVTSLRPEPAQCRHGVPVLCAVPQHDGGGERRLRPEGRQAARSGDQAARRGDAGADQAAPARRAAIPTSSPAASSSAWRSPARSPIKPQVLLLDEPLSALDAKIRVSLREEIRAVQRELGITTIYVTHDQEEALSMSDRIVVMSEGRIEQIGTPFEIYNFPRTRFVASFVGTLNILRGRVLDPEQRPDLAGRSGGRGRPRHQRRPGRRDPLGGAAPRSRGDRAQWRAAAISCRARSRK